MRTKILTLVLICFFIFVSCNSPVDPGIGNIIEPDPANDVSYSCEIKASVSVNTAANGDVSLFIDGQSCEGGNPWDIRKPHFSPLPDNLGVSEGAVSFWKIIPPGTHTFIFVLNHTTLVVEPDYPEPSLWTVKMNISSSNQELVILGGVQEATFAEWDRGEWGYQKTFVFSISK